MIPGAVSRSVAFIGLWLVLSGVEPADLPAGVLAVVAATWTSLRLLPPGNARFSPAAVARLALRFLREAVIAGADVAWRALDPRLPLRPGLVACPVRFPPGPARNAFCVLTSLLPGTLPTGSDENGALLIHCLDVRQPVVAHLATEERLFARALGGGRDDG